MTLRGARFARIAINAISVLLALFHGVLLWQRLSDGTVLEPAVAIEWIVGLFLLLGIVRLYRRGSPALRSRSALVLWLLVLLLHAISIVPAESGSFKLDVEQELLVTMPLGLVIGAVVVQAVQLALRLGVNGDSPSRRASALIVFDRALVPFFISPLGSRGPPARF